MLCCILYMLYKIKRLYYLQRWFDKLFLACSNKNSNNEMGWILKSVMEVNDNNYG